MTSRATLPRGDQAMARLLERMRVVNRISVALGQSRQIEDIHLLTLSAVVSRRGLGCSRAILLARDDTSEALVLQGALGLGPLTAEESESFDSELRAEEAALEHLGRQWGGAPDAEGGGPERLADLSCLDAFRDLKDGAIWIATFQFSALHSSLNARVRQCRWTPLPDVSGADPISRAVRGGKVILCETPKDREALPEPLNEILDERFAVVPLTTSRGLRAVALTDRRFHAAPSADSGAPEEETEGALLDWLRQCACMALENAELVDHLREVNADLKEFDRLKNSFLATLSHELRTPLTSILGYSEILLKDRVGESPGKRRDLLERIIHHGGRLSDMISDLLEIAEVEGGGLIDLDIEPVDPLAAFMNAMRKLTPRLSGKDITVEPDLLDGTPTTIPSNAHALERILFHLLDNAVKFTSGAGRVDVVFGSGAGRFWISVTDTGVGFDTKNSKRIFDHFYQADTSLTRRHNGIGMGLTITKKLVDALGGRIEVESAPGKGATFTLSLPLDRPDDQTRTAMANG